MADYTNPLIITSPSAEIGDDVYAKSATPWQPEPWQQQMQHGEPLAGQAAWELPAGTGGLQTDETYLVFVNSAFRACVANDITDTITSVAHGLTVGTRVYFRSSVNPDGIVTGTPYWVDSVTDDTFKLKSVEDLSGSFVDIQSEGTAVYFVATSYRSANDEQIGTIPATDVYVGEGEAATIVAAIKADADLGTATGGLVANVALLVREETHISGTDADVITIVRNDTVSFTFDVTTDFTGYTGLLTIRHRVTDDELMQVAVTVTSSVLLTVPLSSTDTAFTDLVSLTEFGPHPFDIQMTSGSTVKTPVRGVAVIRRDQTT